MYFDRQGAPLSVMEWARKFEDLDYKVVAKTTLPDGREVSTIWLGVDHGWGGERRIFETVVFPDCDIGERYATELEALAGHADLVRDLSHSGAGGDGGGK